MNIITEVNTIAFSKHILKNFQMLWKSNIKSLLLVNKGVTFCLQKNQMLLMIKEEGKIIHAHEHIHAQVHVFGTCLNNNLPKIRESEKCKTFWK